MTHLTMEHLKADQLSVIDASRKSKSELIALLYKTEEWGFINPNIPERYWPENGGKYHPPIHVFDKRTRKPVNLIKKGLDDGIFYQSQFASIY